MKNNRLSLFLSIALCNTLALSQEVALDKVIISATGFEQDFKENARNIIILDGEDLRNKGYTNVKEALERTSSISFYQGNDIDLRGQGEKSRTSVKVMLDGRMLNSLDAAHETTPLNVISIEQIDRIEIIPGGGAVLYGNGTRGGVINIISKKNKTNSIQTTLKTHGYDHAPINGANLALNASQKLNDKVAIALGIDGSYLPGYRVDENNKGYFATTKLFYDNENSHLSLSANYASHTQEVPQGLTKAQLIQNRRQKGSDDSSIYRTNRPELAIQYTLNQTDITYDISAFYQQNKQTTTKAFTSFFGDLAGSYSKNNLTGGKFKAKYNYLENSYFVLGYDLDYHTSNNQTKATKNNQTNITERNGDKLSNSVFFLNHYALNPQFAVSGGARYEHANYHNTRNVPANSFTSKKTSQNYALELTPMWYFENANAYAKFERGFISPTPRQFVGTRNNQSFSPNLKSETYQTYEIGLWKSLDLFVMQGALFYTNSHNEIFFKGDGHGVGGRYYNIGKTRRIGGEIELREYLIDKLELYQNASLIQSKILQGQNKGEVIANVPRAKIAAGLSYELLPNLQTFGQVSYTSSQKDFDAKGSYNIKAFTLVDWGLGYDWKDFKASMGVKNLFNEKYYLSKERNSNYYPADGRSYYAQIKYTF